MQPQSNEQRPYSMHQTSSHPQQQSPHCRSILIDLQHPAEFGNNEFINNNINNNFQHQQQQHPNNSNVNSIVNNLCNNNVNLDSNHQQQNNLPEGYGIAAAGGGAAGSGTSNTFGGTTNLTFATDILGFHTNPINLGVSEFGAKSKTLSKGNKKRSRQLHNSLVSFNNNEVPQMRSSSINDSFDGENLNLASAGTSNPDSKSTSKFFESLKENVFMEVSALIESNDLRPYFLIQLFRDLQLMSSSDPMRQQTLQSIHNLYNRYVESTIQEEVSMFGGSDSGAAHASSNLQPDELDGGGAGSMLMNNLRMEAKMENDEMFGDDHGDRSNDDGLQRRHKRRYRNRADDGLDNNATDQFAISNHLLPANSSTSSQSTPIVRYYFLDLIK